MYTKYWRKPTKEEEFEKFVVKVFDYDKHPPKWVIKDGERYFRNAEGHYEKREEDGHTT